YGAVEGPHGLEARIAVPARFIALLAEVGEDGLPTAAGRLAERQQRLQLLALHTFERVAALAAGQHAGYLHHVLQAVRHEGVGRLAVAAGAARLLVVALEALGQVEVRHEANVGLVDAHAERDGGYHDHPVLAQETFLVAGAHLWR